MSALGFPRNAFFWILGVILLMPAVSQARPAELVLLDGRPSMSQSILHHVIGTDVFTPFATLDRPVASLARTFDGRLLAVAGDGPFLSLLTLAPTTGQILDELVTDLPTELPGNFAGEVRDLLARRDGTMVIADFQTTVPNTFLTRISVVDATDGRVLQTAGFIDLLFGEIGEDHEGLYALQGDRRFRLDLDDPNAALYNFADVAGLEGFGSYQGAAPASDGGIYVVRSVVGSAQNQLLHVDPEALVATPVGPAHTRQAFGLALAPNATALPIPALHPIGLLGLVSLLGCAGLFALRQRVDGR